jgi:hypothetical protein
MKVGSRVCLSNNSDIRGFIMEISGDIALVRWDTGKTIATSIDSLEMIKTYRAHSADWLRSLDKDDPRKPSLD